MRCQAVAYCITSAGGMKIPSAASLPPASESCELQTVFDTPRTGTDGGHPKSHPCRAFWLLIVF